MGNLSQWTRCFLTKERLNKRIVCDKLGNLYNKEAVTKLLMNQCISDTLKYISRKTIIDIQTFKNKVSHLRSNKLMCQASEKKMDGGFRTIVSTSTGYVFCRKITRLFPQITEEIIGKKISEEEWINLCPLIGESKFLKIKLLKQKISQKRTLTTASTKFEMTKKSIEKIDYIYKIPKEFGIITSKFIHKKINVSAANYNDIFYRKTEIQQKHKNDFMTRSINA